MRLSSTLLFTAVAAALAACEPKPPSDVDKAVLDEAVSRAIGSPSTCVLVADKSGKLVYRYGSNTTCARSILACDVPGTTTAKTQLLAAQAGAERTTSCETAEEASRGVAWASGALPVLEGKPDRQLVYSAFMEGPEAQSGREVRLRLEAAFRRAGL
jgi:hypothetical protein